ncbi:MAG TPA: hypothetical protein PKB02_09555 [Anaerohalosphaeraceae bacterium]|nr:hypothetical protein [Anaerohalosphaeraceae bacterium]
MLDPLPQFPPQPLAPAYSFTVLGAGLQEGGNLPATDGLGVFGAYGHGTPFAAKIKRSKSAISYLTDRSILIAGILPVAVRPQSLRSLMAKYSAAAAGRRRRGVVGVVSGIGCPLFTPEFFFGYCRFF